MNGRNRHLQYRRSVYRRRRLKIIFLTLGILLAVGLVAFLIVGTLLHNRSEDYHKEEENRQTVGAVSPSEGDIVPDIRAYPVVAQASDDTTLRDRFASLAASGGEAASVALNTENGSLLYASDVALSMGMDSNYTVTAGAIASAAAECGIRVSGVYRVTSFEIEDPLLRSVALSREAAILAEAIRSGLTDIVLFVPSLSVDQVEELLYFAEDVRRLAPHAVLGLSLPHAVPSADDAAAWIDRLYGELDFLALDASACGDTSPAEYVEATITDPGMLYYLLRYHMRVLLPTGASADEQALIVDAVERNGLHSWQFLS